MIHSAVSSRIIGIFVFGRESSTTIVNKRIYTWPCPCRKEQGQFKNKTAIKGKGFQTQQTSIFACPVHLPRTRKTEKKRNIHVVDVVWREKCSGLGCLDMLVWIFERKWEPIMIRETAGAFLSFCISLAFFELNSWYMRREERLPVVWRLKNHKYLDNIQDLPVYIRRLHHSQ